jgi:hypothetical protein
MALCYMVCMIGIPLDGPTWMLRDNTGVISCSTIPPSTLNQRHNALYHCVCECIAAKVLYLLHIDGTLNPSYVITEALGWAQFWPLIGKER